MLAFGPHAPFPFARTLATLDAASGGRVLAGLGTGWSREEHQGTRVTEFGDRDARLEELLDVCAAVWGAGPEGRQDGRQDGRATPAPASMGPGSARPVPVPSSAAPGPARPIPVYLAASV